MTHLKKAWIIWLVAALYYSYEFFLRISPTVMVPDLMKAFSVDAATLGVLSACYYYAYASLQIPVGMLLDRFGIQRLLTLASVMVAVGCFAFAHTGSLAIAELGRVLMGIGSAFAFISCIKLARNWFSHTWLAVVIGLTNTLGVIGAISAEAPLAHFVDAFGWRHSLWIAGFIGISLAILIFLIVRDRPQKVTRDEKALVQDFWKGFVIVIKNPRNWMIGLFGGLMVAPISAFTELWGVPFFMQAHGLTRPHAALLSSFMFIGIACGGPLHGWISGQLKSRITVLKYGVVSAFLTFATVLYVPMTSMPLLAALLFIFGLSTSSMLLCFAINSEANPLFATGVSIGFTNMLVMAGGAIFQPLVGHFLDRLSMVHSTTVETHFSTHDFQLALSVLLLCHIIAFILVWFIRDRKYG
jgi:sugar phosphate permease